LALDHQQNITAIEQEMEDILAQLRVSELDEQDRDAAETWIEWLDVVRVWSGSITSREGIVDLTSVPAQAILKVKLSNSSLASRALRRLQALCRRFVILPRGFYLPDDVAPLSSHPLSSSAFSDVYKAQWGTREVALKVLRMHTDNQEKVKKVWLINSQRLNIHSFDGAGVLRGGHHVEGPGSP
jgi:hypothetical protein